MPCPRSPYSIKKKRVQANSDREDGDKRTHTLPDPGFLRSQRTPSWCLREPSRENGGHQSTFRPWGDSPSGLCSSVGRSIRHPPEWTLRWTLPSLPRVTLRGGKHSRRNEPNTRFGLRVFHGSGIKTVAFCCEGLVFRL